MHIINTRYTAKAVHVKTQLACIWGMSYSYLGMHTYYPGR